MKPVLAVALVALLVTAGCGGSGDGNSDTQLDVGKFTGCFGFAGRDSGLAVAQPQNLDLIASGVSRTLSSSMLRGPRVGAQAGVGAVELTSDNQEIQVVAERTSGDAEDTVSQYDAFGVGQVERFGTVVVAADNTMTDAELDPIKACLSDQGIE